MRAQVRVEKYGWSVKARALLARLAGDWRAWAVLDAIAIVLLVALLLVGSAGGNVPTSAPHPQCSNWGIRGAAWWPVTGQCQQWGWSHDFPAPTPAIDTSDLRIWADGDLVIDEGLSITYITATKRLTISYITATPTAREGAWSISITWWALLHHHCWSRWCAAVE